MLLCCFRAQFQFRKAEKTYQGKKWFVETKEHIAESLDGITVKQVRTSFKRLITADLIETVRKKSPYHGNAPVNWYRLTDAAQSALWGDDAPPQKSIKNEPSDEDSKVIPLQSKSSLVDKLEEIWREGVEADGDVFTKWSAGRRKAVDGLIAQFSGHKNMLEPSLRCVLKNWSDWRVWMHDNTSMSYSGLPDKPDLMTVIKFADNMANFWHHKTKKEEKEESPHKSKWDKHGI